MSFEVTNNFKVDEMKYKKEVSVGAGNTGNTTANIPVGEKAQIVVLLEKLGITQKEYTKLSKDPEFLALETDEEKIAYVTSQRQQTAAEQTEKTSAVEPTGGINIQPSEENSVNIQNQTPTSEDAHSNSGVQQFDKKAFDKLDINGKLQACMTEAAKNKYMYGGESPMTEEAWNNLSKEERNKLVSDYQTEFSKQTAEYADLFKDEAVNKDALLNGLMNQIQASNMSQVSLQDFNKMDISQQQAAVFDYLGKLVNKSEDNLGLNKYDAMLYEKNNALSRAISSYVSKQTGEKVDMSLGQTLEYIKDNNVNMIEVMSDYLESKNPLSDAEKNQLEFLEEFKNSELYEVVKSKYESKSMDVEVLTKPSALEEDILSSKYGEKFQNASDEEKMILTCKYMKEISKNKEEYHASMEKYLHDIISRGDLDQAFWLYKIAGEDKDTELQKHFAESKEYTTILATALNIDSLDAENTGSYAQNVEELEDKDFSRALGLSIRKNKKTTDEQKVAIAEVKVADEAVQLANIDMQENAETAETQIAIGKSIAKNSTQKVNVEATKRIGNLKKEAQLEVLDEQLKLDESGEVKEAASESISTLHKDNQLEALKMVKYSVQDMDEEFAKKIEMNLADQIELCDKDNQFAMHKEVMTSKFSEVQERAASNIKNYDPSVQSAAIDTVYESGNKKAIQQVIETITKMPPDVQATEIVRLAGELAMETAISESDTDSSLPGGTLTYRELQQLSPSQRRAYYAKMFENATPAKKIEMLIKIAEVAGLVHKRTIYTLIARSSMLKSMVDRGMGKSMLDAGLPVDAVNKILTVMRISTNNKVIGQLEELKKDSGFAKYFDKDEIETAKVKSKEEPSKDWKNTLTPTIDHQTLAKLTKHGSTMYINS